MKGMNRKNDCGQQLEKSVNDSEVKGVEGHHDGGEGGCRFSKVGDRSSTREEAVERAGRENDDEA